MAASKTLAYSNKGGFWKTRYSFISSCYSYLNKMFFSGKETLGEDVLWRHNDNTPNTRTMYYGGDFAAGSSFAASFNASVSKNKIYKSFSLEGTQGVEDRATNVFFINTDNSPIKQGDIGKITDRGGILYGHIGYNAAIGGGSSIRVVGLVTDIADIDGSDEVHMQFDPSANPLPSSEASRYVFGSPNEEGGMDFYELGSGETFNITSGSSYANLIDDTILIFPLSIDDGNLISLEDDTFGYRVFIKPLGSDQSVNAGILSASVLYLIEVNPEDTFGDPPRGQYATTVVSVSGAQPYEINALNLNYEPTDLDHNQ